LIDLRGNNLYDKFIKEEVMIWTNKHLKIKDVRKDRGAIKKR